MYKGKGPSAQAAPAMVGGLTACTDTAFLLCVKLTVFLAGEMGLQWVCSVKFFNLDAR